MSLAGAPTVLKSSELPVESNADTYSKMMGIPQCKPKVSSDCLGTLHIDFSKCLQEKERRESQPASNLIFESDKFCYGFLLRDLTTEKGELH